MRHPFGGAATHTSTTRKFNMWLRDIIAFVLRRLARFVSPPRRPEPPDPAILDQMTVHVSHELAAMEAAVQLWTTTNHWIALEDSLLHARLLGDFFWPTDDRHTENAVWAEHYLPVWRGTSGGPPRVLRDVRHAIDGQLAHIGRNRVTSPQDLGSSVVPITNAIWDAWTRLLRALGNDPRAAAFRRELASRAAVMHIQLPAGAT
ncbi:MAG: hypothetical protein AAB409_09180 [Gemmatimonadota bacterium]